ncbi:MAG TPA: ATP-binding cassette domain-containing protein [Solirubrobacteraceae bacterium]
METIIQTDRLTKRFGSSRGMEDVSMSVQRGEVFGFLGPNGAGKTTTIRSLLDLLHPTSGSARAVRPRQPARQPRHPCAAGEPAGRVRLRAAAHRP